MVEADLPVCGRVRACSRQILIQMSVNRRCRWGDGEARQASKWRVAQGLPQARTSAQAEVANESWDFEAAPHCQREL
jgi:hypothetical protein